jgi:hypothetical protein
VDFTVELDGRTARGNIDGGQRLDGTWSPGGGSIALRVPGSTGLAPKPGPWAVFEFLAAANSKSSRNVYEYSVINTTTVGRGQGASQKTGLVRLEFDSVQAPGIFSQILDMGCVGRVVQ